MFYCDAAHDRDLSRHLKKHILEKVWVSVCNFDAFLVQKLKSEKQNFKLVRFPILGILNRILVISGQK